MSDKPVITLFTLKISQIIALLVAIGCLFFPEYRGTGLLGVILIFGMK